MSQLTGVGIVNFVNVLPTISEGKYFFVLTYTTQK